MYLKFVEESARSTVINTNPMCNQKCLFHCFTQKSYLPQFLICDNFCILTKSDIYTDSNVSLLLLLQKKAFKTIQKLGNIVVIRENLL